MTGGNTHALICLVCGENTIDAPWLSLEAWGVGFEGCCWMEHSPGDDVDEDTPVVSVACWPICSNLLIDAKFAELAYLDNRERDG